MGNTYDERKNELIKSYSQIKEMYELWIKDEPDKQGYYNEVIKKIDACIHSIKCNKKINLLIDLLLITSLGAYVSSFVLNKVQKTEKIGWFSDRDKLLDVENGLAIDIFLYSLHCLMKDKNFQFLSTIASCNFDSELLSDVARIVIGTITPIAYRITAIILA